MVISQAGYAIGHWIFRLPLLESIYCHLAANNCGIDMIVSMCHLAEKKDWFHAFESEVMLNKIRYDTIRYDMIRYIMMQYDMIQYGKI